MGEQLPKIFDQGKKNATELKKSGKQGVFFNFGPKKLARGEVADLKNEENCKKKFFRQGVFFLQGL